MNVIGKRLAAVSGAVLISAMSTWVQAKPITSFTATDVQGKVTALVPGQAAEIPAVKGETYPLGTQLVTDSAAMFKGALVGDNVFTIQGGSGVTAVKGKQGGKSSAVCLDLAYGSVSADLPSYPADMGFQVKTKMGRYTVVGTAFSVSFGSDTGGSLDVSRGEVMFSDEKLEIPAITAGGQLVISGDSSKDSSFYTISAQGAPVVLLIGGKQQITLAPGSTLQVGVDNRRADQVAAIAVTSGSAAVGGQTLGPDAGAVFVHGTSVMPYEGADQYIAAARQAAAASNQLEQPGLSDGQIAELKQARQAALDVLDKAGDDVLHAVLVPPYVYIPRIPPSIEPQSPSGANLPPSR